MGSPNKTVTVDRELLTKLIEAVAPKLIEGSGERKLLKAVSDQIPPRKISLHANMHPDDFTSSNVRIPFLKLDGELVEFSEFTDCAIRVRVTIEEVF